MGLKLQSVFRMDLENMGLHETWPICIRIVIPIVPVSLKRSGRGIMPKGHPEEDIYLFHRRSAIARVVMREVTL